MTTNISSLITQVEESHSFRVTQEIESEAIDKIDMESGIQSQTSQLETIEENRTSDFASQKSNQPNPIIDSGEVKSDHPSKFLLDGKQIVVKDNLAVRGLTLTCGLSEFSIEPQFHATVVDRLLQNGGTIIGKGNMDALAIGPSGEFSERGAVINPVFENRVPGGSSSGSAAAVAADLADVGIGTDTGGSIRKPAAFCNLVGMKPTTDVIPRDGLVGLAPSLDTIGPLASDVELVAKTLFSLTNTNRKKDFEYNMENTFEFFSDSTIGIPTPFLEISDDKISERIKTIALEVSKKTGCDIEFIKLDNSISRSAYPYITSVEFSNLVINNGKTVPGIQINNELNKKIYGDIEDMGLNKHISHRMLPNIVCDRYYDGELYDRACNLVRAYRREITAAFNNIDLILTPTVPIFPPHRNDSIETRPNNQSMNTRPFNLSGNPAIAIPAGTIDNLPVSAQVVAPRFEDELALKGGQLIEDIVSERASYYN